MLGEQEFDLAATDAVLSGAGAIESQCAAMPLCWLDFTGVFLPWSENWYTYSNRQAQWVAPIHLFQHVSPLGWEHVNLTGDYTWHTDKRVAKGGFRPLRNTKRVFSTP
jgi:hypothetical protein